MISQLIPSKENRSDSKTRLVHKKKKKSSYPKLLGESKTIRVRTYFPDMAFRKIKSVKRIHQKNSSCPISSLHQKPLRQISGQLGPHGLYAIHDLLLMAHQRDAERVQLSHCQSYYSLHRGYAAPVKVVQIARHLDRGQPLRDGCEGGHVWGVWGERVARPAERERQIFLENSERKAVLFNLFGQLIFRGTLLSQTRFIR